MTASPSPSEATSSAAPAAPSGSGSRSGGRGGANAQHLVDRSDRYDEASSEAHGGDLTAPDEVVGQPSGDAEELAGALDRHRQRLVRLLCAHDPGPTHAHAVRYQPPAISWVVSGGGQRWAGRLLDPPAGHPSAATLALRDRGTSRSGATPGATPGPTCVIGPRGLTRLGTVLGAQRCARPPRCEPPPTARVAHRTQDGRPACPCRPSRRGRPKARNAHTTAERSSDQPGAR
jgi:hypothetical protein